MKIRASWKSALKWARGHEPVTSIIHELMAHAWPLPHNLELDARNGDSMMKWRTDWDDAVVENILVCKSGLVAATSCVQPLEGPHGWHSWFVQTASAKDAIRFMMGKMSPMDCDTCHSRH